MENIIEGLYWSWNPFTLYGEFNGLAMKGQKGLFDYFTNRFFYLIGLPGIANFLTATFSLNALSWIDDIVVVVGVLTAIGIVATVVIGAVLLGSALFGGSSLVLGTLGFGSFWYKDKIFSVLSIFKRFFTYLPGLGAVFINLQTAFGKVYGFVQ